jgi:ribose 1,5-bisphosphokinase
VLLTVKEEVLRERLLRRNRESLVQIEERLRRNALFTASDCVGDVQIHLLDNSGELAVTVENLLKLITVSVEPDRT